MSLATLDHQRWSPVTVATNTAAGILDAIYTTITQTTDYAGVAIASPLTNVTKRQNAGVTESVDFGFAVNSLSCKAQICGVNAARTPLMSASTGGAHTYSSNTLMVGITRSAGAYQAWDHATAPWTSGATLGLQKWYTVASFTAAKIHAFISAETLWVYLETSAGSFLAMGVGALIDPETATTTAAETDGRLYGALTTAPATAIPSSFHNSDTNWLSYSAVAGGGVSALVLQPGTGNGWQVRRHGISNASSTTTLANAANEAAALPMFFVNPNTDRFLGRLREVTQVRDSKMGLRQAPGGTDRWYYAGSSTTADADCIGYMT